MHPHFPQEVDKNRLQCRAEPASKESARAFASLDLTPYILRIPWLLVVNTDDDPVPLAGDATRSSGRF
jgi:hypothetical protein